MKNTYSLCNSAIVNGNMDYLTIKNLQGIHDY